MPNTIAELLLMFPIFITVVKAPQPQELYVHDTGMHPVAIVLSSEASDENGLEEPEELDLSDIDEPVDYPEPTEIPQKKTIFTMSESELNTLSISQKAKLLHMNKKTFKTFVRLVNRESGPKMQDKILVAAVVWNRKYCKQYPKTVKKVMYQGGQFTLRGQKKTVIHGNVNDKKAQLAILLAYRKLHTNQIPHNVMNFNSISYRQGSPSRFKKYKHYNNYFLKDTRCHCPWCSECS